MIEINELIMNVPDMSPQQGEQLGHDVAVRLMETLPQNYSQGSIDSMNIKLTMPLASDHDQIVSEIAEQIRFQVLNR